MIFYEVSIWQKTNKQKNKNEKKQKKKENSVLIASVTATGVYPHSSGNSCGAATPCTLYGTSLLKWENDGGNRTKSQCD